MHFLDFLTILIGKLVVAILRLFGRDAGNFPGIVVLTLRKRILGAFQIDCPIIAVTGTNGKTSVANYLSEIFTQGGNQIITNPVGNNLDTGICSLLLHHCTLTGKVHADYLILETDESHVPVVYRYLKLDTLVVLNFFRDQLDRNGEVETLIGKVNAFCETFEGNLILNADDPNTARLGQANLLNENVKYFTVERYSGATVLPYEVGEGKFCPFCGAPLRYEYYQYSHIGRFRCEKCDFGDVPYDTVMSKLDLPRAAFCLDDIPMTARHHSIYYMYNLCAVYAAAKCYSITKDDTDTALIRRVFETYDVNNGRLEKLTIGGSDLVINLAKNPVGANMTLRMMNETRGHKELLFVLNDNLADGHDVSWIWDINFSVFEHVDRVLTCGTRAYDIAIRIKCAGYDPSRISVYDNLDAAMEALFATQGNKFAIANYTAVQPTRAAANRLMKKRSAGQQAGA